MEKMFCVEWFDLEGARLGEKWFTDGAQEADAIAFAKECGAEGLRFRVSETDGEPGDAGRVIFEG